MREYMSSLFNSSVIVTERGGRKVGERERMAGAGAARRWRKRVHWKYYVIVGIMRALDLR
jgi:hypothetical protein